jgi:hypothetical protein
MTDWLGAVGLFTAEHREARAQRLEQQAKRRRAQQRLKGDSEGAVLDAAHWFVARASGQRRRIETVRACGRETLQLTCQACGLTHERPGRCGNALLCVACRTGLATQKRFRFMKAHAIVIAQAVERGLLDPRRRGGRFGERFVTLTVPHLIGDSVTTRIARVTRAWPLFLKEFNRELRARDVRTLHWFRVFEWTPGSDGKGHPHLHFWAFSPYLAHEWLRDLWRQALLKGDCTVEACRDLIVHVEAITAHGGARELVKYMTKDIDANGHKIDPALYAEVYRARDGGRTTQASKGFMKLAEDSGRRCECGANLPLRVRRTKPAQPGESAQAENAHEPAAEDK